MTETTAVWVLTIVALTANLSAGVMFLARGRNDRLATTAGMVSLASGVPALVGGVAALIAGLDSALWIPLLIWAVFTAFGFVVDVARPVEFRSPRRPAILAPFLTLFYLGTMSMWGVLFGFSLVAFGIVGVTYVFQVSASIGAQRRGVG